MASAMEWPRLEAGDSHIDRIVKLSRYYGSDPDFVLAGGGNTSVKLGDRLWVKGSGVALADITAEGFVEMDRSALERILDCQPDPDRSRREELYKTAVMAARVRPEKGQRPSVEVVFHHLMPGQFVVHTHATVVNMFTCCEQGESLIAELFGQEVLWVPGVDPGLVLAQAIRDGLREYERRTGRSCPRAVIMQNHGLIVCADDPEQIRQHTDWVISTLQRYLESRPAAAPFGKVSRLPAGRARFLVHVIGPALRGLLAVDDNLKVVRFDDCETVLSLVGGADGKSVAEGGPLMPDQIVYCKAVPAWFNAGEEQDERQIIERLRAVVREYEQRCHYPPQVVLVAGLGMFTAGDDPAGADTARLVYTDAIRVMAGARRLGRIHYLPPDQREFFEHWEVEAYRRKIARGTVSTGRVSGKIALVTGAAQGIGLEIARDLASQGACVVLGDVNVQGVQREAEDLVRRYGPGRALGLPMNVTDGASVEEAVHQAVRTYGGLDLVVSNAGVLRAGSVKTQPEKEFDLVTAVNYKGFFLCVQKTAPVLARQHLSKPDYWSDIIQINSKSGLQGSNRNGAYAGSKFGGIGLTQSFALELVEDGIKVNAICPGNFFDGPLWSDPDNGLFVQYLRSGKVPGAKSIADVRRAYEAKIPMGRGCTAADVMKAVYYVVEQKYETGQALPVTGGQVMLG